jgi:hypothetical protein
LSITRPDLIIEFCQSETEILEPTCEAKTFFSEAIELIGEERPTSQDHIDAENTDAEFSGNGKKSTKMESKNVKTYFYTV